MYEVIVIGTSNTMVHHTHDLTEVMAIYRYVTMRGGICSWRLVKININSYKYN